MAVANEIHGERGVRFAEVNNYGRGIGSLNGNQQAKGAALG